MQDNSIYLGIFVLLPPWHVTPTERPFADVGWPLYEFVVAFLIEAQSFSFAKGTTYNLRNYQNPAHLRQFFSLQATRFLFFLFFYLVHERLFYFIVQPSATNFSISINRVPSKVDRSTGRRGYLTWYSI